MLDGLLTDEMVKTRSITRVVRFGRWGNHAMFAIQSAPGELAVNRDHVGVDMKDFDSPFENLDEVERDVKDAEAKGMKLSADDRDLEVSKIGGEASVKVMAKQIRITRRDHIKYGYIPRRS